MATTDDAQHLDAAASSPQAADDPAASATPPSRGRTWWAVGVGFLVLVGLVAAFSGGASDVETPTALDEFTFQTPDGGTATLDDFDGPLVVNYFAAWCAPCRAELPDFESVHREVRDEVTFVGVSRDTVTDAWLNLVDDTGITFATVYEGTVEGSFVFLDGRAMPTTVFITADGEIAEIWGGPLDDNKLRELIAEHLT